MGDYPLLSSYFPRAERPLWASGGTFAKIKVWPVAQKPLCLRGDPRIDPYMSVTLIPAGYMAKKIRSNEGEIPEQSVVDIYSVSECISVSFCAYRKYRRHNGYDLFNTPADLHEVATLERIAITDCTLLYYEALDREFNERTTSWSPLQPDYGLRTSVQSPTSKDLIGFDIVSIVGGSAHGCSPLSCNALAGSIKVNEQCLIPSCEAALAALESGRISECEPGPYRVYAVYRYQ